MTMMSYHPYAHTLYRIILKEVRKFFDADARFCLKIHIRERFEANGTIQKCKLIKWHAIGRKHLTTLRLANSGDVKATEVVLNRAYGRKGKRRKQLMAHIRNYPAPKPAPLIPHMPRTCPPTISEPLEALIKSQVGKTFKNILPVMPILLPGKQLDKRREANIKHRHHSKVLKSLDAPLPEDEFSKLEEKATKVGMPKGYKQPVGELKTREARNITPRYMRRRFLNLLKKSPKLVQEVNGKFSAEYSALIKRQFPAVEGVFDGLDVNGKLVKKQNEGR
ncbi:hypothetical protein NEOLI_002683 [Neolecta irregularis DAH-3]|uniref:LYR motif-containing protein Cup1-like N-terminal domain-containing protein n=1 Tax=Neolecta irregularis (strain DAH-3) TaxID=1198029 RepID=A0A1U7LWV9_NEOID|nr:hypothetical protein NEOLI_002683 [Neolecta irregularis DAH-3]|eukprot:OLL27166.1 hypothetical protein NEOLI_002683 [Neolecta irregularis DAH-3]